jgi:hypothetical protein
LRVALFCGSMASIWITIKASINNIVVTNIATQHLCHESSLIEPQYKCISTYVVPCLPVPTLRHLSFNTFYVIFCLSVVQIVSSDINSRSARHEVFVPFLGRNVKYLSPERSSGT